MPASRKIMGVGRNAITRIVGPTVDTNDKVAVTNTDSTPDYLWNKITAGNNITFTLVNSGGDESITVDGEAGGGGGGGTTNWATGSNDSLYHANAVGVGAAQVSSTAGTYPFSVHTNASGLTPANPMVYIKNEGDSGPYPAVTLASNNATTTWFQVGINQTSHFLHKFHKYQN